MKNGDVVKLDALICATGFDTSFRPPFPLVGLNGQDLRDLWAKEPRSYLTIAAPDMPNYFSTALISLQVVNAHSNMSIVISGPNFPLANGCLIPCLEQNIKYAFQAARKLQHDGIKRLVPNLSAINDFQDYKDSMMEELVWSDSCVSW